MHKPLADLRAPAHVAQKESDVPRLHRGTSHRAFGGLWGGRVGLSCQSPTRPPQTRCVPLLCPCCICLRTSITSSALLAEAVASVSYSGLLRPPRLPTPRSDLGGQVHRRLRGPVQLPREADSDRQLHSHVPARRALERVPAALLR